MPRGQPTPPETRLQALAELEAMGDSRAAREQIAEKYGVSRGAVEYWKAQWDAGEIEDEPAGDGGGGGDEPAAKTNGATRTAQSEERIRERELVQYAEMLAQLPEPPEREGARRDYSADYKYTIARTILARQIPFNSMCRLHQLSRSMVNNWLAAVQSGELKGKKLKRNAASTTAQKSAPAPSPRATQAEPAAPIEVWTPPVPASRPELHVSSLADEVERLRVENTRLRAKLRQALAMVIDDHE